MESSIPGRVKSKSTSHLQQYPQLPSPAKPMIIQPAPRYSENITSEGFKVVTALCSFQPCKLNQLAFDKYDKLIVIDDTSDTDWWRAYLASDPLKQSGAVPSSLMTPYRLQSETWFFEGIHRRQVELMLKQLSINGAFLIRNSLDGSSGCTFILSLFNYVSPRLKPVIHYRIHRTFGRYYLTPTKSFPMLADLVRHYSTAANGLPHRLTRVCPRVNEYSLEEEVVSEKSTSTKSTLQKQCRCCGPKTTVAATYR